MENIKYLYKILLSNKDFYFCYLRIFLLFLAEKYESFKVINLNLPKINFQNNILDIPTLNKHIQKYTQINKLNPKIFILNGHYIYSTNIKKYIRIKFIAEKNRFKDFFDYTLYNNLNFFYILNFFLLNKKINISLKKHNFKNKKLFIINFFNNNQDLNILTTKKNVIFNNDSSSIIFDVYLTTSINTTISTETFLNIKEKCNVTYTLLNNNAINSTNFFNIFSKQDHYSSLYFSDIISDYNNVIIYYYFFLSGRYSDLQKKSFKKSKLNFDDKRTCNVYHYNNKSTSSTLFGSLVYNKSTIIFEGNIIVGADIKEIEAHLKCEGLLLSNKGTLEFRPNMFIHNNDVKCTHGASIGHIDDNIINYMRSRGLKISLCKKIIIKTFIKKYLNTNKKLRSLYKTLTNYNYHE